MNARHGAGIFSGASYGQTPIQRGGHTCKAPSEFFPKEAMIFAKTEVGQQVLKDRSVPLTPRQRSAFIMFDGKRSVQDVLAATQAMGVVPEDVQRLVELGLLEEIALPAAAAQPAPAPSGRTPQQRYQDAYPIATRLTANLGLRGFRLNLAVEAAASYEQLLALSPKIGAAVGPEQYAALDKALNG